MEFTCKHCGAPVPQDARFCPQCGQPDPITVEEKTVSVEETPATEETVPVAEETAFTLSDILSDVEDSSRGKDPSASGENPEETAQEVSEESSENTAAEADEESAPSAPEESDATASPENPEDVTSPTEDGNSIVLEDELPPQEDPASSVLEKFRSSLVELSASAGMRNMLLAKTVTLLLRAGMTFGMTYVLVSLFSDLQVSATSSLLGLVPTALIMVTLWVLHATSVGEAESATPRGTGWLAGFSISGIVLSSLTLIGSILGSLLAYQTLAQYKAVLRIMIPAALQNLFVFLLPVLGVLLFSLFLYLFQSISLASFWLRCRKIAIRKLPVRLPRTGYMRFWNVCCAIGSSLQMLLGALMIPSATFLTTLYHDLFGTALSDAAVSLMKTAVPLLAGGAILISAANLITCILTGSLYRAVHRSVRWAKEEKKKL